MLQETQKEGTGYIYLRNVGFLSPPMGAVNIADSFGLLRIEGALTG